MTPFMTLRPCLTMIFKEPCLCLYCNLWKCCISYDKSQVKLSGTCQTVKSVSSTATAPVSNQHLQHRCVSVCICTGAEDKMWEKETNANTTGMRKNYIENRNIWLDIHLYTWLKHEKTSVETFAILAYRELNQDTKRKYTTYRNWIERS